MYLSYAKRNKRIFTLLNGAVCITSNIITYGVITTRQRINFSNFRRVTRM